MDVIEQSGCKGLLIGFESLSQLSNNRINKGFNSVKDYYTLVRELHSRGITIMGCFVLGLDEDDKSCLCVLNTITNADATFKVIAEPTPDFNYSWDIYYQKRFV